MKSVLFIVTLMTLSLAQAATLALNCSAQGDQLQQAVTVQNQLVSAVSPATLALVLGEDEGAGTYMTYVHATLSYLPGHSMPLVVSANAEFSQLVSARASAPLQAEIVLKSRVNRADMVVKINCQPVSKDYLLVPTGKYSADPLYSFQDTATTMEKYLADLKALPYSFHPLAPSESEYLAANYCVKGDATVLLKSLQALDKTVPGFWHANALGQDQLLPNGLNLNSAGISWSQPLQSATCTASHTETGVDEDGQPTTYTVCDHQQINDLAPLQLAIPFCQ